MYQENQLTESIIGAAIEVHKAVGPGLLESTYEECLCYELSQQHLSFERQVSLPIQYKTIRLDCGYRLDIIVEHKIVLELKSVETITDLHKAQLITYLKMGNYPVGLLLNFNVPVMKNGITRLVN